MKFDLCIRYAACLAALAALAASCARDDTTVGAARHVIVISLDTTRPDHLGCYGNPWVETPYIDALAGESIVFTDLMTVAPQTLPSHTSLFTGTYPHTHGVARNHFVVSDDNLLLAEMLEAQGFHTAAFVASFPLARRFGLDQGFAHYDQEFTKNMWTTADEANERPANEVTDAVIKYVGDYGIPDRLFLFVHYYDPHKRYIARKPYVSHYRFKPRVRSWLEKTQGKDVSNQPDLEKKLNSYASEISFVDEHVGRLIDYLREVNILDDAVVVITSDHGENLIDHGIEFSHGRDVYQSTVDGIFMIRLPAGNNGGKTVDQVVSNLDIPPTLLQYLGMEVPAGVEGDAVDVTGEAIAFPPRVRFAEANRPEKEIETDPRWQNMRKARCVRDGDYKFIQTPYLDTEELYDLGVDPFERHNLLVDPDARVVGIADRLRLVLQQWAESAHPLPQPAPQSKEMSEETLRRLKALGYVE